VVSLISDATTYLWTGLLGRNVENPVLERVNRYLTLFGPTTFMRRFRWVSTPFARHPTKFT
jgi:hypothetical protein